MTRAPMVVCLASLLLVHGCRQADPDAPPAIAYGQAGCAECGMIISDERFGVATIVQGPRGPEATLFDDFNCQVVYERERPDLTVLRRWARDHGTREWLDPDDASFVFAESLRTPMGSRLAAFATQERAGGFATAVGGEVLGYDNARETVER